MDPRLPIDPRLLDDLHIHDGSLDVVDPLPLARDLNRLDDWVNGDAQGADYHTGWNPYTAFHHEAPPRLPPDAYAYGTVPVPWNTGAYPSAPVSSVTPNFPFGSANAGSWDQLLLSLPTSTRSVTSSSLKSWLCNYCSQSFDLEKDLNRHVGSKHRVQGQPLYVCKCGYNNPRKDNHRRHLRSPDCKRPAVRLYYTCICGWKCEDKTAHMRHFEECGRRPQGRPRRS
ncbi:hypothetical protein GGR50DRAFT_426102 [Xylaria sp. CBS 124048]|nr:hypothetical protein GGR50DRAFT_426102 [Xylaria sp. CBS 124048]